MFLLANFNGLLLLMMIWKISHSFFNCFFNFFNCNYIQFNPIHFPTIACSHAKQSAVVGLEEDQVVCERKGKYFHLPLCKPLDSQWAFLVVRLLLSICKSKETKRACQLVSEVSSADWCHPFPPPACPSPSLICPSPPTLALFHPPCWLTSIKGALLCRQHTQDPPSCLRGWPMTSHASGRHCPML